MLSTNQLIKSVRR